MDESTVLQDLSIQGTIPNKEDNWEPHGCSLAIFRQGWD